MAGSLPCPPAFCSWSSSGRQTASLNKGSKSWGWTATKTPPENVLGQKLIPCPLPSAPPDTGGHCWGCHSSGARVTFILWMSVSAHLQKRPHITLASFLHCCCFILFYCLMENNAFFQMLSISIKLLRNPPQRLLTWLGCGFFFFSFFFSFASSQSFSQLLEELKLGPFKCKWSNLQNMYFGMEATWLCKQTGVLLILWTAISGSYLVAVIWVLMRGDCFHLS